MATGLRCSNRNDGGSRLCQGGLFVRKKQANLPPSLHKKISRFDPFNSDPFNSLVLDAFAAPIGDVTQETVDDEVRSFPN